MGDVGLSNNYTLGSGDEAANNGSSFASRREVRANNTTGNLPPLSTTEVERNYVGVYDFEQMLVSLHELFEHDRHMASQSDSTRCGICYLHFAVSDLHYRAEGLYMCQGCEEALGKHTMPVVKVQQKL